MKASINDIEVIVIGDIIVDRVKSTFDFHVFVLPSVDLEAIAGPEAHLVIKELGVDTHIFNQYMCLSQEDGIIHYILGAFK